VAYVTCGDPDLATTREIVFAAIEAGADVIELGVPFSDPVADGPVIQRASERALKKGICLEDVLRLAGEVRERSEAGLVVFSYCNPVLRMGLERFCGAATDSGVDGVLLTDMTLEEAGEYRRCMQAHHLAAIFLAAPTSTEERLRKIAQALANQGPECGRERRKTRKVAVDLGAALLRIDLELALWILPTGEKKLMSLTCVWWNYSTSARKRPGRLAG
jgi:tryptophan synthase alpha subunit